jgi:hypothetical protein
MRYGKGRTTPLIRAAKGQAIDAINDGIAKDARKPVVLLIIKEKNVLERDEYRSKSSV